MIRMKKMIALALVSSLLVMSISSSVLAQEPEQAVGTTVPNQTEQSLEEADDTVTVTMPEETTIPSVAETDGDAGAEAVQPEVQPETTVDAEKAQPESEESQPKSEKPQAALEEPQWEAYVSTYSVGAEIFHDVSADAWYCSYASYVLNKGIMTGMGDGNFAPGASLSRAQFATVLYRVDGQKSVEFTSRFGDVPQGTFFTDAVMWASQEAVGVVEGYENGQFGSSDQITREQMVTMMYRYAQYKEKNNDIRKELESYPDFDSVSGFAEEAMKWAVGNGIIQGDQGLLNPQGNTSRAVCATIIQRFCEAFLPGELPDISLEASVGKISMNQEDADSGDFTVMIENVTASPGVKNVRVPVWSQDDQSDMYWYTAEDRGNGTYGLTGNIRNHGYHVGEYKLNVYVVLSIGISRYCGEASGNLEGSEAQIRINSQVEAVYNETGRDLNATYWWLVNNITYETLPIPVDPPSGFTRREWYAILGLEQRMGDCYCYAAAFYYLAKGLGYDAEFVEGRVGYANGGSGYHGWVVIHMDGASYICDPEAQSEEGLGQYNLYMQPIDSPIIQYIW